MEQHFGLWNPGKRREISFGPLVKFTSCCLQQGHNCRAILYHSAFSTMKTILRTCTCMLKWSIDRSRATFISSSCTGPDVPAWKMEWTFGLGSVRWMALQKRLLDWTASASSLLVRQAYSFFIYDTKKNKYHQIYQEILYLFGLVNSGSIL